MLQPGEYFIKTKEASKRDRSPKGTLVLITEVDEDGSVHWSVNEESFYWDQASFLEHYSHDPEGPQKREQAKRELIEELRSDQLEAQKLKEQLSSVNLQLDGIAQESTDPIEELDENSVQSLVPVRGSSSLEAIKRNVALIRNTAAKYKKSIESKQERLRAMVREEKKRLEAQMRDLLEGRMGELSKMIAAAEEALFSFNVYLGKNETIHWLRKGKKADKNEPIVIRQQVLYLDEECAALAEQGGIDINTFQEFDKWILESDKHLDQLLPEKKGLVAVKIRRTPIDYGDSVLNEQLNEANLHTYILLRNLDNIFRISSEMEVGTHIFPKRDEFDHFFFDSHWDFEKGERVKEPLDPSSRRYQEAVERMDAKTRHFGRVALMVQGILDRTAVFHPLPAPRINILDRKNHDQYLRFVRDAELLLTTGRKSFDGWLKDLNSRLDVGHRVMGVFNNWSNGISRQEVRRRRLRPPLAALPRSLELHTIERREGENFIILYNRNEETWRQWQREIVPVTKRGACVLKPSDTFILNFDLADIESMEFYLQSRVDRHNYLDMIPLLKAAIELKKREREEEAPFKLLLTGEIMSKYQGVTLEEAQAAVDALVPWWKLRNFTHRALTSDDAKALRMIVEEFGHRRKRDAERETIELTRSEIIKQLLVKTPAAVYIGHKRENRYVVLAQENEENIFVREQEWTRNSRTGELKLSDEKRWKTVDSRRLRWEEYWTSQEAWDEWKKDVRPGDFLTDAEIEQALSEAWTHASRDVDRAARWHSEPETPVFWPLAFTITGEQKMQAWVCDDLGRIPLQRLISERLEEPRVKGIDIDWERKRGGIVFSDGSSCHYDYKPGDPPWKPTDASEGNKRSSDRVKLLWKDDEAIARFEAAYDSYLEACEEESRLEGRARTLARAVEKEIYERTVAEEKRKFLEEYGDEELWPDSLKMLDIQQTHSLYLRSAINFLVERGIDPEGLTIRETIDRARQIIAGEREEKRLADEAARVEKEQRKAEKTAGDTNSDDEEDEYDDDLTGDEPEDFEADPLPRDLLPDLVITVLPDSDEESDEDADEDEEETQSVDDQTEGGPSPEDADIKASDSIDQSPDNKGGPIIPEIVTD